jgi:hypothetical protein
MEEAHVGIFRNLGKAREKSGALSTRVMKFFLKSAGSLGCGRPCSCIDALTGKYNLKMYRPHRLAEKKLCAAIIWAVWPLISSCSVKLFLEFGLSIS